MANTKSAKKNVLINQRNRGRNLHHKSKMKTLIKKAVLAIENNIENKIELLRNALRTIDKTVSAGVIKKSTAARRKSRLTLLFNKSTSDQPVVAPEAATPKVKKARVAVLKKAAPKKAKSTAKATVAKAK